MLKSISLISLFAHMDLSSYKDKEALAHAAELKRIANSVIDSEKLLMALIHLYHLKVAGLASIKLRGGVSSQILTDRHDEMSAAHLVAGKDNTLEMSDVFLKTMLEDLVELLASEKCEPAIEALKPFNKLKDDIGRITLLRQVLKDFIAPINISQIMRDLQSVSRNKLEVKGQDVVVMLGKTGAGKSTTAQFLCGSTLKKTGIKINVVKSAKVVQGFAIGNTGRSESRDFKSVDLAHPEIKALVDHKLPSSLVLCDPPGFGDTEGGEKGLVNSLVIVNPLRTARSVRLLVLLQVDSIGQRGDVLRGLLDDVSRLIPNIKANPKSIYFCFTGEPPKATFIGEVVEKINNLLADRLALRLSENTCNLLELMKEQISKKNEKPFINFEGKLQQTPRELVDKLKALTPITNPAEAIVPYVETKDKASLELQLNKLFEAFKRDIQQVDINNFDEKLSVAAENLEYIKFIHDHWLEIDKDNLLVQCEKLMLELAQSLISQAGAVFNADQANVILTPELLKRYEMITRVHQNLRIVWVEQYSETVPPAMQSSSLLEVMQAYRKQLQTKLTKITEIQYLETRLKQVKLVNALTEKPSRLAETDYANQFPVVLLTADDEIVKSRVTRVSSSHEQHEEIVDKLARLKAEIQFSGSLADMRSVVENLSIVERELELDLTNKNDAFYDIFAKNLGDAIVEQIKVGEFLMATSGIDALQTLAGFVSHDAPLKELIAANLQFYKSYLIQEIYNSVPDFIKTTEPTAHIYNEADTKQLVYTLQVILQLVDDPVSKKILQNFEIPDSASLGLLKIYNLIFRKVDESFKAINVSILGAIKDENDMSGIQKLGDHLQQIWFILSIPSAPKRQAENLKSYRSLLDKVRSYVVGFRQRFGVLLQSNDLVTADQYAEIANYLDLIKSQSFLVQLDLMEDSCDALIKSVEERFLKFTPELSELQVAVDYKENIRRAVDILNQLDMIVRSLESYLSENQVAATYKLSADLKSVLVSYMRTMDVISANAESVEALTFDEIVFNYGFLEACLDNKIVSEEAADSKSKLDEALAILVQSKVEKLNQMMATLVEWQTVASVTRPNEREIARLVSELEAMLQNITSYKNAIPDFERAGLDLQSFFTEIFVTNARHFTSQLEIARNARLAGDDNSEERHEQLISLCNKLTRFDTYIVQASVHDRSIKTYKRASEKYDKKMGDTHVALFQSIFRLVRSGQYADAAAKATEELKDNGVRRILNAQVSKMVATTLDANDSKIESLQRTNLTQPEGLLPLLAELNSLPMIGRMSDAGILSEAVSKRATQQADKGMRAVQQWFERCAANIDQSIDGFMITQAETSLASLSDMIAKMSIKPENAETELKRLGKAVQSKIEKAISVYHQPVTQWNAPNVQSLAVIAFQLREIHPDAYSKAMQGATTNANNECKRLERELNANTMRVGDVIKRVAFIESSFSGLNMDEIEPAMASIRGALAAVAANILSPDIGFGERFEKICELMREKNALHLSGISIPVTDMLKPIATYKNDLVSQIVKKLKNKQYPKDQMKEFVSIYHKAKSFGSMEGDRAEIARELLDLIRYYLQLRQNSTASFNAGKKAEAVSMVVKVCNVFAEINETRKELSDAELADFGLILPVGFDNHVSHHFVDFLKLFKEGANKLENALSDMNVKEMFGALELVSLWADAIPLFQRYINAFKPGTMVEPFIELNALLEKFTYQKISQQILEKFEAVANEATMTYESFVTLAGKTLAARTSYYQKLVSAVSSFESAEKFKRLIDLTDTEDTLVKSLTTFLAKLYQNGENELRSDFSAKADWDQFGYIAQDLSLFADICSSVDALKKIKVTSDLYAVRAFHSLNSKFKAKLKAHIDSQVAEIVALSRDKSGAVDEAALRAKIVDFAISLQKIVESMPIMAEDVKKQLSQFFGLILKERGGLYVKVLSDELMKEESGLGRIIIDQQACFKGMAIASRNLATSAHGVDYMIEHMEKKTDAGAFRPIDPNEATLLREAYDTYLKLYDKLIADNLLPETKFDGDKSSVHFANMRAALLELMVKFPVTRDSKARIIWDENARTLVPQMLAYLSAMWTLRDAGIVFSMELSEDRANYLKKPHAGQILTIFRMLNIFGEMHNNLVQLLSGQGKSIVLALMGLTGTLLGYDADATCYSQYLSERDYADFVSMFKFMGIIEYLKYGTFNSHFEDLLNERAELRDLIEDIIMGTNNTTINPLPANRRPRLSIIDEVDVFFKRDFFGSFYNPSLMIKHEDFFNLLNEIWKAHHNRGIDVTLDMVVVLEQYRKCADRLKQWSFLLEKAVPEMLAALKEFKKGHEYTVVDDKIAYAYQDGTSTNIVKGYATMWAYFYQHTVSTVTHKISRQSLDNHVGLLVNCGSYSYTELLKNMSHYSNIVGVTGTLRELSEPELAIIRDEFNIRMQTTIPSAYGESHLSFHTKEDVIIVKKDEAFRAFIERIVLRRVGIPNGQPDLRPVLFIPRNLEMLNQFYEVLVKMDEFKGKVSTITKDKCSTAAEQSREIATAARPGQITLIDPDLVRGRDTICYNTLVNTNGGMYVLSANFPLQFAEERQQQCRAARQGQQGGFGMVLVLEDLKADFGVTDEQVKEMRDQNTIYETLCAIREAVFKKTYEELTKKTKEAIEVLHKPSMALWNALQTFEHGQDTAPLVPLLKALNSVPKPKQVLKTSRTLVLFDRTGSMGSTIDGVKACLTSVIQNLGSALQAVAAAPGASAPFVMQLGTYTTYTCSPSEIFRKSDWSSDSAYLQRYINAVALGNGTSGSYGTESVEVGLCHAVLENDVTQVILIGDAGGHSASTLHSWDLKYHQGQFYSGFKTADRHATTLGQRKIPLHAFYVDSSAKDSFELLARCAGGSSSVSHLDVSQPDVAARNMYTLFGQAVIADMVDGDEAKRAELMAAYSKLSHTGR